MKPRPQRYRARAHRAGAGWFARRVVLLVPAAFRDEFGDLIEELRTSWRFSITSHRSAAGWRQSRRLRRCSVVVTWRQDGQNLDRRSSLPWSARRLGLARLDAPGRTIALSPPGSL